jgi:uncharacterized membrane protein YvlD (DUF360 family)
MVRTLIKIAITIVGNAVGLLVASLLLDDVQLDFSAFIIAVLIFTVAELIIEPLIEKLITQHAEKLRMFTALVTTFLALLITDVVSDGLSIEGVGTWLLATVIVWLGTLLAGVILVRLFLEERRDER